LYFKRNFILGVYFWCDCGNIKVRNKTNQRELDNMTNQITITKIETLSEDTFFTIEINTDQKEIVSLETMKEIIKYPNNEVSYEEELETEEGTTVDQLIDAVELEIAEDEDGLTGKPVFDIYKHKMRASFGEITYDVAGEYVKTFKTEKGAQNWVKKNK
jgi:hypothetical protein